MRSGASRRQVEQIAEHDDDRPTARRPGESAERAIERGDVCERVALRALPLERVDDTFEGLAPTAHRNAARLRRAADEPEPDRIAAPDRDARERGRDERGPRDLRAGRATCRDSPSTPSHRRRGGARDRSRSRTDERGGGRGGAASARRASEGRRPACRRGDRRTRRPRPCARCDARRRRRPRRPCARGCGAARGCPSRSSDGGCGQRRSLPPNKADALPVVARFVFTAERSCLTGGRPRERGRRSGREHRSGAHARARPP